MDVDAEIASQWLKNVTYYRLSGYSFPARVVTSSGMREDHYKPGTKFSDVVELYEADRKLRTLIHDGMERIEVSLRSRIVQELCVDDPLSYENPNLFVEKFAHADWLKTVQSRIDRAREHNESIKHYEQRYGDRYPFWVVADVLDFSDISKMFGGLSTQTRRNIGEGLGVVVDYGKLTKSQRQRTHRQPPLTRWYHQLTIVRNACAHHGRLWNKSFIPAPTAALQTVAPLALLPDGQSSRIYGTLLFMSHLVRVASPGTSWPSKVANLVTDSFLPNPLVIPEAMGLPPDWSGEF